MVKAHIITEDGTKIIIEGNQKEVAELIDRIGAGQSVNKMRADATKSTMSTSKSKNRHRTTPMNLINSLIDGGFFGKPKDLAAVKVALEELGHVYPVTSLSPTLLRLVRRRQLRRIKDKNRWLYTGYRNN